jgi:hypothetical protein
MAMNMQKVKNLKHWLPEIYFFVFALGWAFGGPINYPPLVLAAILLVLFFTRNRVLGMLLATILGGFSAYLILALLSDFSKHPVLNANGIRFLGSGTLLIVTNITMAVFMFRKYGKIEPSEEAPL